MRYFEINRYNSGEVYAVRLFGKFIDFRKWYQVYEQGAKKLEWSAIWYTYDEIEAWLEEKPDLKYRQITIWRRIDKYKIKKYLSILYPFFIYLIIKKFRSKK